MDTKNEVYPSKTYFHLAIMYAETFQQSTEIKKLKYLPMSIILG